MNASDLTETCELDRIVMTSWKFDDLNNVSLSEIHESLLYGFELKLCWECMTTKWGKNAKRIKFVLNIFVNTHTS